MFKIFIAETILKTIIEEESKKTEHSRSYIYKVLRERQTLYVSAPTPDMTWADTLNVPPSLLCHRLCNQYFCKYSFLLISNVKTSHYSFCYCITDNFRNNRAIFI